MAGRDPCDDHRFTVKKAVADAPKRHSPQTSSAPDTVAAHGYQTLAHADPPSESPWDSKERTVTYNDAPDDGPYPIPFYRIR